MKHTISYVLTLILLLSSAGNVLADEWRLVTDAATLQVGDQVVIASNSNGYVGGQGLSYGVLATVNTVFSNDMQTITSLGAMAVIFTLNKIDGAWTLSSADGTSSLGATAEKGLAVDKGEIRWTISVSSDGSAIISNVNTNYGRILYAKSLGILSSFTTYKSKVTSSLLAPQLYRLEKDSNKQYVFMYDGLEGYSTRCGGGQLSKAGETFVLSSGRPEREGLNFDGWLYDDTLYQPGDSFTMPASDVTLTAQWSPASALPDVADSVEVRKLIRNNALYIIVDGVMYDVLGRKQ